MTTKKAAKLFESTRNLYFPRWRNGRQWRVKYEGKHAEYRYDGLCDSKTKTIYLVRVTSSNLIHEICHAVTTPKHESRWQRRMLKAADHADALLDSALASELRADVEVSRNAADVTADMIYNTIHDWVGFTPNPPSLEAVIEEICNQYGMWREFLFWQYPRTIQVYEQAVKESEEEKILREQFEGL